MKIYGVNKTCRDEITLKKKDSGEKARLKTHFIAAGFGKYYRNYIFHSKEGENIDINKFSVVFSGLLKTTLFLLQGCGRGKAGYCALYGLADGTIKLTVVVSPYAHPARISLFQYKFP